MLQPHCWYGYLLEEDEIQSGFISIVVVGDVTHNNRIESRYIVNFFVSSVFLEQVRYRVISEH